MRYDTQNNTVISFLHPAAKHKVHQVLEELELIGENVLLASGFRTLAEQAYDYASGRTRTGPIVTNAKPGWSFHNYGLAVDLVPVGPLGIILSKQNKLEWAALGRYANIAHVMQAAGFEWGFAMWNYDRPHFQYTQGLTIEQVHAYTLPDVEKAKQERIAALEYHIDLAKTALTKNYLKSVRRAELEQYVKTMSDRLLLIV